MLIKSHTFKIGDRVIEKFDGTENEATIESIAFDGKCTLVNDEGERWHSNLVWLILR